MVERLNTAVRSTGVDCPTSHPFDPVACEQQDGRNMEPAKWTAKLREHYLFSALTATEWETLLPDLTRRELATGAHLFFRDEPAGAFFVTLSGAIKLYRLSLNGQEKVMRLVRAGQSFGESILFSPDPRYPVSALALQASQVIAIEREAYLRTLRGSFDTCRAIMAQMTLRIYAHWDEIEGLSLHRSRARVAQYLLALRNSAAESILELPLRKSVIASQLGLAPETFSRGLRALMDRDLIAVNGSRIAIKDARALERLADT